MASVRFYDTLTRSVRDFTPHEPGRVTMYTCGPTVYRPVHIGNLRTFIAADLLRRALELEGLAVRKVMNVTDVGHMTDDSQEEGGEDKMQLASEDEGLSPAEIAEKYTAAFHRDAGSVNILPAAAYPKATDHIAEMVELTATLMRRGHAYEVDGMVYFDVDSFPTYGALSNNTVDQLAAGHRALTPGGGVDPKKRRHYDFTLWRAAGPRRLMKWASPWGEGYPGWHIECSAMSLKHLGDHVDVHTGGADLVFPHHEDEIAQSEGATGHQVVGAWSHAYHLLSEGRKMAKSAGNFYVLGDLVQRGADPLAFRYLALQTRYREPTNFTWEALAAADRGLERYRKQMVEWFAGPVATSPAGSPDGWSAPGAELDRRFREAVADDLNTPRALAVVAELGPAAIEPAEKYRLLTSWDRFLGLDLGRDVTTRDQLPPGASEKIEARERARGDRDWASADRIRAELAELGIEVIDTPQGTRWLVAQRRG
jgi:cysteinyl-tRNA synthetase